MSARIADELAWQRGSERPQLYGCALWVWASMGDLVHSSVDPRTQLTRNPNEVPVFDRFIIGTDSATDKNPLTEEKLGSIAAYLFMSSWEHMTEDDQHRPHIERRFTVEQEEEYRDGKGKVLSTWSRELMIGQGSIIQTTRLIERETISEGEEDADEGPKLVTTQFDQAVGTTQQTIDSLLNRMSRIPGSHALHIITTEKRRLRRARWSPAWARPAAHRRSTCGDRGGHRPGTPR